MRQLLRELKRQWGWFLFLLTLGSCATSCVARAGYVAESAPVYYAPAAYYYRSAPVIECSYVDWCPSGTQRCCYDHRGGITRVLP